MSELYNTSHEHRCIFIHVPKTAGTSIKKVFDFKIGGHWPWYYYAENHAQLWQQYTSFAVVRNPWDRAVSAYRFFQMKTSYWHTAATRPPIDYEVLHEKSFEECLEMVECQRERLKAMAWHNQTAWLAGPKAPDGRVMVNQVLRFENLDQDFAELCQTLDLPPQPLLKMNRSKRSRDYQRYYNDETRARVERVYAADIEAFGYTF
jgi:chondroitin 4-sulfotransferase 11